MTVTIKPLTPELLADIEYICAHLRQRDREEMQALCWTDDLDEISLLTASIPSFGYIFYADDVPVAVLGAAPAWPGVYNMFLYGTDDFKKVGKSVTSFVKRVMLPTLVDQGAHRAHCFSIEGYTEVHKWLESFGSVREGVLKKYGRNQEDFVVFAWISENVSRR